MRTILERKKIFMGSFTLSLLGISYVSQAQKIDFSGEIRLRPEYRRNAGFNEDTHDTASFVGSRMRLTASGQASDQVFVKATIQDSRNWGEESSAVGLTNSGPQALDLHEGYAEFRNFLKGPVTLRAGRQELVYGDQRLIGNFGWSNQGRAFDAYKFMFSHSFVSVDAWAAKRKENNAPAGEPDRDRDFYGIYSTLKLSSATAWDVYFLLDREADTATPNRPRRVATLGTRVAGNLSRVDYTIEFPYQFGDNGTKVAVSSDDVKIQAFALAAKAGYTWPTPSKLRVGAEYDYATGDDNPADDKAKTFNNLYPTNHFFYGTMDYQGWRNLNAFSVNASAKPAQKLFVSASYWKFGLAEEKDGWYNAAGAATGSLRTASDNNAEKSVGDEVDLLTRYAYDPNVTFEAGYGHFFAGPFIKQRIANHSDSDWAYVMTTVKF